MKYLPDLIPRDAKVLPDYFKGSIYGITAKSKALSFLLYFLAVAFFLVAIAHIAHPLLTLLYGSIGFVFMPSGHKWIERRFRFRLTTKIKSACIIVLFILSVPFKRHYDTIDQRIASGIQLSAEKAAAEQLEDSHKKQQEKDSFDHYMQAVAILVQDSKPEDALTQLHYATDFAVNESERAEIDNAKSRIAALKTFALIKRGKYQAAIPQLTTLLFSDPNNSDLLYNRAVCYSKTGKIREAVEDLKPLLEANNEKAGKLYEKINPIRKKIIGYETLCCDGTTSNATGRGACSHHGGVCDWNNPIYEESRKYE